MLCMPVASALWWLRFAMKLDTFRRAALMCLLAIVPCGMAHAQAPRRAIAQYPHAAWGAKEGAGDLGRVWFGYGGGAVLFIDKGIVSRSQKSPVGDVRVAGVDKGWQDAGGRRDAFYTNLGPGKHRFHVAARDEAGAWNVSGTVLDFSVAPAWFQTIWFRVLCLGVAFVIVWVVYRMRVRQVAEAMSARFDERLAERTRIARDLHDTLLQTIQGSKLVADSALKQSADPVRMRAAMEQVSVWLGRATNEGRAALNSLRTSATEKNDLAAAFQRAIEECRMQSSMEASFSAVGEVSEMHPIVRDEVYRIGYEAIRNACAHSQAAQLQVELTYAEDLILRVQDNGVGIAPAVVDEGKEGHFGLQGMRERARRIMAKLTVETSAVSGTEITLVVPGSIIYSTKTSGRKTLSATKSLLKRMGLTSNSIDS